MVFHWSLSDSKSPQVSRTRLSILAVFSNAVVWIVSTCPPTSKSFRPFNNPLVTVPNAPITIGTIVTFMFHSFFSSLARSRYLSFFSLFFPIYSVVRQDSKVDNFADSLSFVDYYKVWSSGRDQVIRLYVKEFVRVIFQDRRQVVHIPFVCMVELKFPAHFPVDYLGDQVFWCEMLFTRRLKRPQSCFPSHFCFPVVVILSLIELSLSSLMVVISPPSCFSMLSSSRCMDASTVSSMLASPLPPSFQDTYSLSTSSQGYNALCMVISFLVLWSICLSSSQVHLRKGPEYLTSGTAQVSIPLMRFLLDSFVLSSFRVLLRYSFRVMSFICTCLMVSASKIPKYLQVSFSSSVLILS